MKGRWKKGLCDGAARAGRVRKGLQEAGQLSAEVKMECLPQQWK